MRSASYSSWRASAKVLAAKRGKYQSRNAWVAAATGPASPRMLSCRRSHDRRVR